MTDKRFLVQARRIITTLGIASAISVGLFLLRVLIYRDTNFWYLNWNLLLAWVPLGLSYWFVSHLAAKQPFNTKAKILALLWLVFLPNAFYLATDFIHLQESSARTLLFDVVLMLSFTFNGFVLGYISVYSVHYTLLKRLPARIAHAIIAGSFLLCGFAIYLGRYLRWNTWDIVLNPAGLVFDVSERFLNPSLHTQTFWTTGLFFVFIGAFYVVAWRFVLELLPHNRPSIKPEAPVVKR